jgi:hypothetical protein
MLQKSGIYQIKWIVKGAILQTRFGEHHSSNIARHVLSKINDNQGHSISLDNLKLKRSPQTERA